MVSRYIPADVRRELRQEANFGCAYCGTPLVQYHHIVPFSEEEHHDPSRMIALCPNCHAEADAGTIKQSELYQLKNNPAIESKAEHEFYFKSEKNRLILGNVGVKLHDGVEGTTPVLKVSEKTLISLSYLDGLLYFDVDFHSGNEVIAAVDSGEWWVDVEDVWDVEYKKKTLKIYNKKENLGLAINYNPGTDDIFISGHLSYDDKLVTIRRESGIQIPAINSGLAHFTMSVPEGDGAAISL